MAASSERIDGISWFDDRLGDVASHAAMELDSIRLGRGEFGDWHIRGLATWLAGVGAREDRWDVFSTVFLSGLAEHYGRPAKTYPDLGSFAKEMSDALSQTIWFDPTPNGHSRESVMRFCLEVSRRAHADSYYGRDDPGHWRGVNWWDRRR